jgi:trans-aconitate methyltransferase
LRFYDRLLDEDLEDARAVGWRSSQTQQRNFNALAQIFAGETLPFSVYDVGCGLAGLHAFLKESYPLAGYAGCDIHPGMIERARRRRPAATIEERNILQNPPPEYDYVVASGTFSHLDISEQAWSEYIREMMRAMFAIARRGMAIVFLSTLAEIQEPGDYHQDPADILRFAQAELSPLAEIRHAFSPWTFAIFVYRSSPAAMNGAG